MRKTATFEIDDRKITVKELTVQEILDLFSDFEKEDETLFLDQIKRVMNLSVSGLSFDECKALAPSELRLVYEKFREVNAVFFDIAGLLGLGSVIERVKVTISGILSAELSGLLNAATPASGNTDSEPS